MRIAKYEFADGARLQSGAKVEDADAVGTHLEMLRQKFKGELTPKDVIDDARGHNSPLHTFFEWNDGKAAEQYRLQQARGLIRAVVAVVVSAGTPAQRVQAFVHIPEGGTPHYRSVDHAMSQERTRDMVLQQAFREFRAWQKRYEHLAELADLFTAGTKLLERIPSLKE
jgi:hypothetical protein